MRLIIGEGEICHVGDAGALGDMPPETLCE